MTPVPLDLPVRPNEASEVAALLYAHADRKPLTDDLRNRLAARAAVLRLETLTPHFGSLARDPLHASAYYLAVDGKETPHLLHIAIAGAPTSSVFPKPLLIGRTRRMNGPEIVVNAIPFGPGDRENIWNYATRIDPALLPRPQGSRASITIASGHSRAFGMFRRIEKRMSRNLAAVAGDYHACLWAAIRAGWRREYSIAAGASKKETAGILLQPFPYTRYAIRVTDCGEASLKVAASLHEEIRQARALAKMTGDFEFELEMGDVSAAELVAALEWLRDQGHAPEFVQTGGDPESLAEAARQQRVALSFRYLGEAGPVIEARARSTGGRLNYHANTPEDAEIIAEHLL